MLPADSTAGKRFVENNVNIVLTLLSVVQGLAFSDLCGMLPSVIEWNGSALNNSNRLIYFLLCLFLIMRLFQTYLAGIIYYDRSPFSFIDLLLIFVYGGAEYTLFEPLRQSGQDPFHPRAFHFRFAFLLAFAIIGYIVAYRRARKKLGESSVLARRSMRLQRVNIAGTSVNLLLSLNIIVPPLALHSLNVHAMGHTMKEMLLFLGHAYPHTVYWPTVVGVADIVIICFNIAWSLLKTFGSLTYQGQVWLDKDRVLADVQDVHPKVVHAAENDPVKLSASPKYMPVTTMLGVIVLAAACGAAIFKNRMR